MQPNPAHIVTVTGFSNDILHDIVAHLEVSTDFEHLVYREAELDAIWSITGFALKNQPNLPARGEVARLHQIAHAAHDLVAEGRPAEAAAILKAFL